ncbi:cytochrome c [Bradyrhizobium liaoningense]|uniref:c-type cytochrome n=1 Tax=Bradyrhizobium liaoningense TaxID=43992 RepID=UPI001BA5CB05|nr:cytochrome c [Bradyrhizobium liaoningense]MBR0719380.1 cytochrome c [Bradyrhizobium liaoningense]
MFRSIRVDISLAILITAFFLVHVHNADGSKLAADSALEGRRLAEAWCKPCHAIEPNMAGMSDQAPGFAAIANRHGTTALSLKVFLKTSHRNMPNLVIAPEQADALANFILSLKTQD